MAGDCSIRCDQRSPTFPTTREAAVRILIADDEVAQSKTLRPLFAAGGKGKSKVRATAGAPDIGRLIFARAQRKGAGKLGKGRAGSAKPSNDCLDHYRLPHSDWLAGF